MKTIYLICLFTISFTSRSFAQNDDLLFELSNPLEPGEISYPSLFGAYVMLGPAWQGGNLQSEYCDCPPFTNGNGLRFEVGLVYDDFISKKWTFGTTVGFTYSDQTANYQQIDDVAVQFMESGERVTVPVRTQQTLKSTFAGLSFQPYLKFYPLRWFWLRIGPRFDFVTSTTQSQVLDLLQRKVTGPTGEEFTIEFDRNNPAIPPNAKVNPVQAVIHDGEFPSLNSFQFGISPSLGFDVRLGRRVFFSPFMMFNLPFTGYSSTSTDFRVLGFQAGLEVKVRLGALPPKAAKK